jgi:hypothetical protein
MPEVPSVDAGDDRFLAAVRPSTDDAAFGDDRRPRAALPPMLGVVVEEPFLGPAPRELVRVAAEPLVARVR